MTPDGAGAQRTCLGCRKTLERNELLRYVLTPADRLAVDYRGRLPGRGAYTCIDPGCLAEALRKRQFARAFRRDIAPPPLEDILAELREQIRSRILGLIGMSRKANLLLSGSNLVIERLSGGAALELILLADDISAGIAEKVLHLAGRRTVSCYRMFDKELLGRSLGTAQRSVIALPPAPLAIAIKQELERYRKVARES